MKAWKRLLCVGALAPLLAVGGCSSGGDEALSLDDWLNDIQQQVGGDIDNLGTPEAQVAALLDSNLDSLDQAMQSDNTNDLMASAATFTDLGELVESGLIEGLPVETKDQVQFFYALSQVALAFNPDPNAAALNNVGDILSRFGATSEDMSIGEECVTVDGQWGPYEECTPTALPSNAPTVGELQDFLYTKAGNALTGAVASLDDISPGFAYTYTDPVDGPVEFDASDVLFIKGIAKNALAFLNIQKAYNLNLDIDRLYNDGIAGMEWTAQDIYTTYGSLGRVADSSKLAAAKAYLEGGAADLEAAIAAIQAEGDDQLNDFATFDTQAEIDEALADLQNAKDSLAGPVTVTVAQDDPMTADVDETQEVELDLTQFFAGNVDFRAIAPNQFDALGDFAGEPQDPTFGGVLVGPDADDNGVPDILEDPAAM